MKVNNAGIPLKKGDVIGVKRLSEGKEGTLAWVTFDFGATYPLGELRLWNDNDREITGMIAMEYSISGKSWMNLNRKGLDANGRQSHFEFNSPLMRFARFIVEGDLLKLTSVQFYAGSGLVAEPADEWTRLFHRGSGWTGSDGIYSIPFNGCEVQGKTEQTKTLFLFGDTFIGDVDEATDNRPQTVMINNTIAVLEGVLPEPAKTAFIWDSSDPQIPKSVIVPSTAKALSECDTYYWLQDGTSIKGKFYCFPLIIGPDPKGPEGFQFAVHGVTRVSAPIGEYGPLLEQQVQVDTPLYFRSSKGRNTYFGAAVMPNTEEACVPNPDGYVYVYGLQNDGKTKLVAARVPVEHFEDFDHWTYWNGFSWSKEREHAAPLVEETSCEVSVSPMIGGYLNGKYIIAYQQGGTGNYVSVYIGESPVGPFGPSISLHYCTEPDEGGGIYAYNAKGHPHLSNPGELLISYNVNTTSWDGHMKHASIYRPRFVRLRQIE